MAKSYSDNAVMAKVRAMYGRRLNREDYGQLLQKRSVSEIAGFLKKKTYYAQALQEVNEDLVHREQLESLIRRRTLDTCLRLMKYTHGDRLFLTMYIMQNEIRQIVFALRLLNAGEMNKFIVSLPVYLSKLMSFDLFAVARVQSYDGLLKILSRSEYHAIVAHFRPAGPAGRIDITSCETELLTYYYTKVRGIVDNRYTGDTRDTLRDILNHQIDMHNLSVMYRLKRYFHASPDTIRRKMLPIRAKLGRDTIRNALQSESAQAMLSSLSRQRSLRRFPIEANDAPQAIFQLQRIRRAFSQRIFRFSSRPVVVVICYMALLEIEVNNIVNIIEGVRYGLPSEEIRGMMVM